MGLKVLFAWGENICGQLGDGTQAVREEPVRVSSIGALPVGALHCSKSNSALRTSDGRVLVWGRGRDGLLGGDSGSAGRGGSQPRPLHFGGVVAQLGLGDNHAALVTDAGEL